MFQKGKIETYSEERGFGFIQIEGESRDLFFRFRICPTETFSLKLGKN